MIMGIGTDISGIREFDDRLKDAASIFNKVHFTPKELSYCTSQVSGRPAQHLAARYSAKEALIKALDQARGGKLPAIAPLLYTEIEVANDTEGRPFFTLHGSIQNITKQLGIENIHLSISHDNEYAIAFVIIE